MSSSDDDYDIHEEISNFSKCPSCGDMQYWFESCIMNTHSVCVGCGAHKRCMLCGINPPLTKIEIKIKKVIKEFEEKMSSFDPNILQYTPSSK